MFDDVSARARNHARALRDGTRIFPLTGKSVGDTVRVRTGRSAVTARIVDRFDAWDLRDRCRDDVSGALTQADVDHLILASVGAGPHQIVVSSTDADRLREALTPLCAESNLHFARLTSSRQASARPLSSLASVRPGDILRIFSAQISLAGRLLPTSTLGVDIEVWEQTTTSHPSPDGPPLPAGTLRAPRANVHARFLPREVLDTVPPATQPIALEQVDFPIDVVYTWVDADDPAWQAAFAATSRGDARSTSHTSAWSQSRFTSRDELRYSLRSIAAFASWVRTIHIVTNGQVPSWLDTDHPQIRLVRHDEIFPDASHLPTFNSHAIEANLHRIPGLAEHYLYFNDDVFLARPLRPEHFFTAGGLLRYFPSMIPVEDGEPTAADLPVVSAFKNGRRIIEDRFGRRPMTRPRHTPHPQRRAVIEDIEHIVPDLMTQTSRSRFRTSTDLSIASQLQAYWAAATGRGVCADTNYEFIDIGEPGIDRRLDRMLVRADLDFFCMNETHVGESDAALAQARIDRVLTTLLPLRSSFER